MTNQPTHNIKILRLQNGEDLISDCVMSENDYLVQLNNPMSLIFKRITISKSLKKSLQKYPRLLYKNLTLDSSSVKVKQDKG